MAVCCASYWLDLYSVSYTHLAYAAAREAARRVLGEHPYKVQIMGAIAMHQGDIAEMKTGEGKTLTATMCVYLNALAGKGVHVVTVNEYLAERDAQWMGEIYRYLGLTVGVNKRELLPVNKREAYNCCLLYTSRAGMPDQDRQRRTFLRFDLHQADRRTAGERT